MRAWEARLALVKASWAEAVVVPARGGEAVGFGHGEERASCVEDGASVEGDDVSVQGCGESGELVRCDRALGAVLARESYLSEQDRDECGCAGVACVREVFEKFELARKIEMVYNAVTGRLRVVIVSFDSVEQCESSMQVDVGGWG